MPMCATGPSEGFFFRHIIHIQVVEDAQVRSLLPGWEVSSCFSCFHTWHTLLYWLLHLTCLFSMALSTQPAGPASSNQGKEEWTLLPWTKPAVDAYGSESMLLFETAVTKPLWDYTLSGLSQPTPEGHVAQDRFHRNSFWVIRSLLLGSFLFLFLPWSLVFVICSRICCALKIITTAATIIIPTLFCVVLWSFQNLWHIFPFIKNVE